MGIMKVYFKVKLIDNICMVNGKEIKEPIYYGESLPNKGDIIVVPLGNWISLAEIISTEVEKPNHPVREIITYDVFDLWNIPMNETYHSLRIADEEVTELDIIKTYINDEKKLRGDK